MWTARAEDQTDPYLAYIPPALLTAEEMKNVLSTRFDDIWFWNDKKSLGEKPTLVSVVYDASVRVELGRTQREEEEKQQDEVSDHASDDGALASLAQPLVDNAAKLMLDTGASYHVMDSKVVRRPKERIKQSIDGNGSVRRTGL